MMYHRGTMLAQNTAPQEEIINIAQELGISIRKARKLVQKNPVTCDRGRNIAVHKKFWNEEGSRCQ